MRLSSLAAARPAFYDRNAVSTIATYSGTLSQHVTTTRWTLTVAAGTKLLVELGETLIGTATVAVTPLRVRADVRITSGANVISCCVTDIQQPSTVTQYYGQNNPLSVTIYAGETVSGTTSNDSATGTVYMAVSAKGTTYSA